MYINAVVLVSHQHSKFIVNFEYLVLSEFNIKFCGIDILLSLLTIKNIKIIVF